ncbi:MAG: adenosylcobinamide-phosphate synthase CbiB [Deltaproteobacteria bacterium]|jgi:adenosylcobinamide-phosphate synthase|nr:adenosylcobinamide-phosphate synthase CbiB [Deltaproteobacteria bacterium]
MAPLLTTLAFLLDSIIGDPQSWPHPVRWIGRLITLWEKVLRATLSFLKASSPFAFILAGFFLYIFVVGISACLVYLALYFSHKYLFVLWALLALYLVFASICLRDLIRHTQRVEAFLAKGDLLSARDALSWIVGRDTSSLDEAAIRRAEIETLAENFSDGLVAPLFYLALFGPLFAWIYKATNTLDSMVGYKNEKYLYLGRFSAKMDDLLNYLPARIAALLLIAAAKLGSFDAKEAAKLWRKESRFHTSPNSGQTEATMAGALGVHLGGNSYYRGILVEKPTIGAGGKEASHAEVQAAEYIVTLGTLLALALCLLVMGLISFFFTNPWGWALCH